MDISPCISKLTVVCLVFLAIQTMSCSTNHAGDLEAAPWKHAVGVNERSLPGKEDSDMFFEITPEDIAALPKLAEEGNALAAAMMAGYARHEQGAMNQSVRWLRMAVENGDVDSAFVLGELYFPTDGTLGREEFDFKPDAVSGYVWYAIGLSGLDTLEEKGGMARTDKNRAQALVDGLRMLLLPSERERAAVILSRWPESLPSETPLEPMHGKRDDNEETEPGAPPDADAVVELVRQWTTGRMKNRAGIAVLYDAPPEFAPVLREAFAKMRALSDAGDKEAEYMVAWCRLYGLGTEADEAAAMPVIMAKAETGDAKALLLAAALTAERGDKERAIELATRAAGKGNTRSMLLLSRIFRERDERKTAAMWMRRAAEAGDYRAIEEMISVAESGGDWKEIVLWLTVAMIRTPDPAVAYRCRMLIAYVGSEAGEEALQKAMEAGERWHLEHPVSFVDGEE